jgi:eukaryotic-like serine/threonine-protein kinase
VSEPDRLGRYRLDGVIGTGAFSTVYRAVDDHLEDVVAVKLLAENHSLSVDVRERFLAEGRALRRVAGPHVITVHDLGESDRAQPYLVLELAARGTLADRVGILRAAGWEPRPADVLAVARPLAAALEAVHAADLVHRDLSPGNVLLCASGRAAVDPSGQLLADDERLVLADLGLCKDLALHSGLTAAGGTHGFRAPEQRAGPSRIDRRADIWAASALLVWLVSGAPPVDDEPPEDLDLVGAGRALAPVLARGLSREAAQRHPDAHAWLADIEAALTSLPESGRPEPGSAGAADAGSGPGGVRLVVAAVVLGLIVGMAGGPAVGQIGGPEREVVDGRARVTATASGATVMLTGPQEVRVGEPAMFGADLTGVRDWLWVAPDGALHPRAEGLEVRASTPGRADVRLIGTAEDGTPVEVHHRLQVVE